MDDEPEPEQMDVDEPEEKQVEPEKREAEQAIIDPTTLLDVLQDPNEDAFVAMFDEYGVDFDDMVSDLLGIDVSDLDKDQQLTQKLTLLKQLIQKHKGGGFDHKLNKRIAKIFTSKHHGKHSSFGENFGINIPNLHEHNFVENMSQFLNGQSTEVQLPPPGPAPEPKKAPEPKPKKRKTKPSYSYELLNKHPENIPPDLTKPIEEIQNIFVRGKNLFELLTTSPGLTEEQYMRSRVKLVEKIADSIGIVLARSGADKRIVLDTFDDELQYFDVPEARIAQMEKGEKVPGMLKQWKKRFHTHLASSVKRKQIVAIPPYFQLSQRSKELMSFRGVIQRDIRFEIQRPKRPPTTARDKPPRVGMKIPKKRTIKMTGLPPTTPYPAPSLQAVVKSTVAGLKELEAAEDKRQEELAKLNELVRKEHLSSVPAPLPVQHVPVKPVVRKPPKPAVRKPPKPDKYAERRKSTFSKEELWDNIQAQPKEDERKNIIAEMTYLRSLKPTPEIKQNIDWWSRIILNRDLQSGHNPEALSNNIKHQIERIKHNLKDSAEQLKAYEEMMQGIRYALQNNPAIKENKEVRDALER